MDNSEMYQSAKKRVEAKMGFYTHLSVFAAVILFLALINFITAPSAIWFHWPLLGWGIAVAIHAAAVFVFPGRFGVSEKMIEAEMARLRARS
ncbi:MAG: 2TM domain-containing protein [Roseovarius sp.]